MHTYSAATAAFALAAILPAVQAGKAIIDNHCGFAVAVWPVDINRNPSSPIMVAAGATYSEDYQIPASGGVSLKVSKSSSGGAISQLEYTIASSIFYDVSNIDCSGASCPFQPYGMYLESGSGCPTVSCPGGQLTCTGAYNNPNDVRTLACTNMASNTILHVCMAAGSSSRRSSLYSPAANSTIAAISAPPSTTLATVTVPASTGSPSEAWRHDHSYKRAVQHPHARRHE